MSGKRVDASRATRAGAQPTWRSVLAGAILSGNLDARRHQSPNYESTSDRFRQRVTMGRFVHNLSERGGATYAWGGCRGEFVGSTMELGSGLDETESAKASAAEDEED